MRAPLERLCRKRPRPGFLETTMNDLNVLYLDDVLPIFNPNRFFPVPPLAGCSKGQGQLQNSVCKTFQNVIF